MCDGEGSCGGLVALFRVLFLVFLSCVSGGLVESYTPWPRRPFASFFPFRDENGGGVD